MVYAGLCGLAFGSFLTVVVERVPRGESLVPRGSRCPRCLTPLAPSDNIPVASWLMLRGRCRACGEPIPARYVLLELAMGAVFLAAALRLGVDATLPAFLFVIVLHAAVAAIEHQGDVVPMRELHRASAAVGVAFVLAAAIGDHWTDLLRGVAGAGALVMVFLTARRLSSRVTTADVKLSALTGLALAWAGWLQLGAGLAATLVVGLAPRPRRGERRAGVGALLTLGLVIGLLVMGSK